MKREMKLAIFRAAYIAILIVFAVLAAYEILRTKSTASPYSPVPLFTLIMLCAAFAPIDIKIRSHKK